MPTKSKQKQPDLVAVGVAATPGMPPTLHHYFFSRIDYQIRPDARKRSESEYDGATLSGTVQRVESPNERVLIVRIQLEDERAPYRYHLEVGGYVHDVPVTTEPLKDDMHVIRCVAPALLGALREQLFLITGRGPGLPTLLPLVGMKQLVECFDLQEWSEATSKTAPSKSTKTASKPKKAKKP